MISKLYQSVTPDSTSENRFQIASKWANSGKLQKLNFVQLNDEFLEVLKRSKVLIVSDFEEQCYALYSSSSKFMGINIDSNKLELPSKGSLFSKE